MVSRHLFVENTFFVCVMHVAAEPGFFVVNIVLWQPSKSSLSPFVLLLFLKSLQAVSLHIQFCKCSFAVVAKIKRKSAWGIRTYTEGRRQNTCRAGKKKLDL